VLTSGSSGSSPTGRSTTTGETTTEGTTTGGTTTGGGKPGRPELALVSSQSYCQLQPDNRLGFWITLANRGGGEVTGIDFVTSERYGGMEHANQRIRGLGVPGNAPKLQTVVSYPVPEKATIQGCSVRVFSDAFARSGDEIPIMVRS
jgi:hypothetical protein